MGDVSGGFVEVGTVTAVPPTAPIGVVDSGRLWNIDHIPTQLRGLVKRQALRSGG